MAAIEAVTTAVANGRRTSTQFLLYADSLAALGAARGESRASCEVEAVNVLRLSCRRAVRKATFSFCHVKAHDGEVWNELADRMANHGRKQVATANRATKEGENSRQQQQDEEDEQKEQSYALWYWSCFRDLVRYQCLRGWGHVWAAAAYNG